MALGDLTWFQEAKAFMLDGGWEAADTIKCALITNATVPTAADTTPALTDYTEVGAGGNYAAGGFTIDNWGTMVSQAAGAAKISSANNPTWAQNAGNPTNAYYGIVYNSTDASKGALCFIDLAGPYNMQTGTLTITWNAAGLATY
jgi:hypothetical protein